MKKILFGTSAIAASLFTVSAFANEWALDIDGFHTIGYGFTYYDVPGDDGLNILNNDGGSDEFEFHLVNDGEVHFEFRLVADNGLTFGVDVELETGSSRGGSAGTPAQFLDINGDPTTVAGDVVTVVPGSAGVGASDFIDEASAFVSGSFGKVEIGEQDGAYGARGPRGCSGVFTCAGDGGGFIFDRVGGLVSGSFDANGQNTGDDLKISYFTPNISGFTAGVSFVPELGFQGGGSVNPRSGSNNIAVEAGAQYSYDFDGFGFDIGAGYTWTNITTDEDSFGVGASINANGFSFGGSLGNRFNDEDLNYSAGMGYETGPWAFGVNYFYGQSGTLVATGGAIDTVHAVSSGATYTLAPGVRVGAVLEYANGEDFDNNDRDGFAGGTFLDLQF